MGWVVELANGKIIKENESDITSWRKLLNLCNRNGLTINSIKYNGEDFYPEADAYFILFDMLKIGLASGNIKQNIKQGIGSIFIKSNRCRILWVHKQGNKFAPYTETIKGIPDSYKTIAVVKTQ